jgi:queuosine precursor transporter
MKTVILYLFSIIFVNFMFAHTGPTIGAVLVGVVFVLRDYVQRNIGHYVLLVMLVGCGISFYMASPIVATASLVAFLAAEAADWAIYSSLPFRFQHRVLFSSVIGVAVDTLIFLPMIGVPLWPTFAIAWASKMVAATIVFGFYQVRAR